MPLDDLVKNATLLFVLLNPFLLAVYLLGIMRELSLSTFSWMLVRAGTISAVIFCIFAVMGDYFFSDILHVRFAAFLLFGGIIFMIIGIRFVFEGPNAVELLRGPPEHISRSVAIPFMIGPGTINASIFAGSKSTILGGLVAVVGAVVLTVIIVVGLKMLHDYVSRKNEAVVQRYADLCGRISALVIGTMSVEMIFQGIEGWLRSCDIVLR
jgi:small neutral amino acid transporter SnatA (MarC family)